MKYVMIGMGGCLGAMARFWIGSYVAERMGSRFPYGTFLINCSGCFLVGILIALMAERTHWNVNWRYLLPIGFVGSYTTFSAFELETLWAVQDGQITAAVLNVVLSVLAGLVAVWLGLSVGKTLA